MRSTTSRAKRVSGANSPLRQHRRGESWLAFSIGFGVSLGASSAALAGPQDGIVVQGSASINTSGNSTQITQSSGRAIIDWGSFSISPTEIVNFLQPGSTSITLNRVTGGETSIISGALTANGNIFLLNSAGILFGSGSRVNVGGLIATTSQLSNQDFMAGKFNFTASPTAGSVENYGTISIRDGGAAALVAPSVRNDGIIVAHMGRVTLAGTDVFTVDLVGDNLINFALPGGQSAATASGKSALVTNGGNLAMTAGAVSNVLDGITNVAGYSPATSASQSASGNIVLSAGRVTDNGTIDVSGAQGGRIDLAGQDIGVGATALLNASGNAGGGVIQIGGGASGSGGPRATNVSIASGAQISADALVNGTGGQVTVWGQDNALFAGAISVRGGANGGNGGFIEVSSAATIQFLGAVFLDAPQGTGGRLYLDPQNVEILPVGASSTSASVISGPALGAMLRSGGDVVIAATDSIQVSAAIDGRGGSNPSGQVSLTAGSILIEQPVITNNNAISVTATTGSVTFQGEGYLYVANSNAASQVGTAPISVSAAQNVMTQGTSADAGQLISLGTVSVTATTGSVNLRNALAGLQNGTTATGIGALTVNAGGAVTLDGGIAASANVTGSGVTLGGNTLQTAGNLLLTSTGAGGITVNAVGSGPGVLALDSTGGSVHLVGATDSPVVINGSIRADAGAVTIDSGAAAGGVASISTAANTVLQTGTSTAPGAGGAITLTSTGDQTLAGSLLAGDTSNITLTTGTGNILLGTAITGYSGTGSSSLGVGALGINAGGAVTLAGGSASSVDVSGSSVTTGTNTLQSTGLLTLDATGTGGITVNAVGSGPGVIALDSTTGAVHLIGANDSPVTVGGSVRADAGTITIDSGTATGGVASISTAANTVLQTGTTGTPTAGGAITLVSEGDQTLAGTLLTSSTSGISLTSGSGNITLGSAIVGYVDPNSTTGASLGVGALTATAAGAVTLAGGSASSVDVSGSSVTTGTNTLQSNGLLMLSATGTGGITVNAVGSGPGVVALDSTTGAVHLVGANTSPVTLDGSVQANAGTITIDSGAAAGGVASISSATNTVLQTGTSPTTGSAITLASSGNSTLGGTVLGGMGSDVTVTTGTGDVSFTNAVAGYPGASSADGVNSLTVHSGGSVTLAGATTAGAVTVTTGAAGSFTNAGQAIAAGTNINVSSGTGGITIDTIGGSAPALALTALAGSAPGGDIVLQSTGAVALNGSAKASRGVCIGAGTANPCTSVAAATAPVASLSSVSGVGIAAPGVAVYGTGTLQVPVLLATTAVINGQNAVDLDGATISTAGTTLGTLSATGSSISSLLPITSTGDITLTSTGARGITISAATNQLAVDSSAGNVHLIGANDSVVMINGGIGADQGNITIDSGAAAGGVASINLTANLQTGTAALPNGGGGISLTSVGPMVLDGQLLVGTASPIALTTSGAGGDVSVGTPTAGNAIAGYTGANGGNGVGSLTITAGGAVSLTGATTVGDMNIQGASIANSITGLFTVPVTTTGVGGNITLTSTGTSGHGITFGDVTSTAGCATGALTCDNQVIQSDGSLTIQSWSPTIIQFGDSPLVEARSNISIGGIVAAPGAAMPVAGTNTLNVTSGILDVYVANRADLSVSDVVTAIGPNDVSPAWNVQIQPDNSGLAQPITVTISGNGLIAQTGLPDANNYPAVPPSLDPAQLVPNPGGSASTASVRVTADYPYATTTGLITSGTPYVPANGTPTNIAVALVLNGQAQNGGTVTTPVPVWRYQPFFISDVCDTTNATGSYDKHLAPPVTPNTNFTDPNAPTGCGGNGAFGTNLEALLTATTSAAGAGSTALGAAQNPLITVVPTPDSGSSGTSAATNLSGITVQGSLDVGETTGASGTELGAGAAGTVGTQLGAGVAGTGSELAGEVGLSSVADAENRNTELPVSDDDPKLNDDRCLKGASGIADVGKSPGVSGTAADVYARCRELKAKVHPLN
jgi:filamentous hemagglutinin family protein